jgi:hypothetical protein
MNLKQALHANPVPRYVYHTQIKYVLVLMETINTIYPQQGHEAWLDDDAHIQLWRELPS